MRRLLVLIVALIASAAAASDITPATVLAQMNLRRVGAGLPLLHENPRLDQAAADRMQDMEELGYWAHVAPDGRTPFYWLRARGYDYVSAGENLASGFDTAEVLVDAWMESSGHRQNIMSPAYEECGVAVIEGSTRGKAAGSSIVVLFGRPRNAVPQSARSE